MLCLLEQLLCMYIGMVGGGERAGAGDTFHLQRAARVSHLLAHLCHHGCTAVRWEIFQGNNRI